MSKLEELIQKLCPKGIEYKPLGDIGIIVRGSGLQKKDFTVEGVGCIHYGQIYTYYGAFAYKTKTFVSPELAQQLKKVNKGDLVIAITSENVEDVCKCVAWLGDEEIVTGGHSAIFKHNQNPKYLSYCFQSASFFEQKKKIVNGTKVIEVAPRNLERIVLPIPPIAIQNEIVKTLDAFSELTAELTVELTVELTAQKKRYEYFFNALMSFKHGKSISVKWLTLGEIGRVSMCKRIMKMETSAEGEIPFYKIGTFGKEPDAYIKKEKYDEYKAAYPYPKEGDILISAAGTIGRTVIYNGEPAYYQDSNIVWIDNDESKVLNKYLYYCFAMKPWSVSNGGTIARLYNDNISKAVIPVPPLEEQQRIVDILDRFDTLCNDLSSGLPAEIEARRKQYEYYRDKLLTFKEKSA